MLSKEQASMAAPGGPSYICDSVYPLGTLSCAVCGQMFPLSCSPAQSTPCSNCGVMHHGDAVRSRQPRRSTHNTSAACLFTSEEVKASIAYVAAATGGTDSGAGGERKKAGATAVDNRVIEESFCEKCATHRPCKTFARQTRSADEGQTIFFQCTVCSSEWQQNS